MYCFNERQLELKKRVREFVEQEVIPVSSELDRSAVFPSRLVARCGELGFVDKELMQNGRYSASEVCVILEELARGSASLALALIPHYLACDIMQSAANPEMRQRELEPGFRLERLFAYAISEASGGSDVLGIDTTAIALDKEWILNGSKSWITSMGAADAYLIAARTSLNGRSRNVSLFCVDASAPGLILGESESMIGLSGSPIGTVRFENCRIPLDCIVGTENDGYRLLKPTLNLGRLAVAAVASGISSRALELATGYAGVTGKYGRSLSSYQGISFMLAEMYAKLAASQSMVYCAAGRYDSGDRHTAADVAAAKLMSTEFACEVSRCARQIHGAYGLSRASEVDRCFRDAQMLTIAEGTSEICKIIISSSVIAEGGAMT